MKYTSARERKREREKVDDRRPTRSKSRRLGVDGEWMESAAQVQKSAAEEKCTQRKLEGKRSRGRSSEAERSGAEQCNAMQCIE